MGRPAAARELWVRGRLSELLAQAGAYDEAEPGIEEEEKYLREKHGLRQAKAADEGNAANANANFEFQPDSDESRRWSYFRQMQALRNLEELMAAFDAVEAWANKFNEFQRYVSEHSASRPLPGLELTLCTATRSFRREKTKRNSKSNSRK